MNEDSFYKLVCECNDDSSGYTYIKKVLDRNVDKYTITKCLEDMSYKSTNLVGISDTIDNYLNISSKLNFNNKMDTPVYYFTKESDDLVTKISLQYLYGSHVIYVIYYDRRIYNDIHQRKFRENN